MNISQIEAEFILAAIINYKAFGPPRPDVLLKLKTMLSEESYKKVIKVYGPRR